MLVIMKFSDVECSQVHNFQRTRPIPEPLRHFLGYKSKLFSSQWITGFLKLFAENWNFRHPLVNSLMHNACSIWQKWWNKIFKKQLWDMFDYCEQNFFMYVSGKFFQYKGLQFHSFIQSFQKWSFVFWF